MSRTYKDRPYWVMKNDPHMDRYSTHDHLVTLSELVDEEPVFHNVPDKDGWHWHEEVWYNRKIYKHWTVQVDCTLDVPEGGPSKYWGRPRTRTNEERLAQKNCYWWLEYYPNVKSSKDYKRLTNGIVRSRVRQKLNKAVRSDGQWIEYPAWRWYSDDYFDQEYPWPDYIAWDEFDMPDGYRYANRGWWD